MAQELIYTSVPRGVRAGSSGFCTAAATGGMNGSLTSLLESLSSYQPCYPHYTEQAADNPVNFSHFYCRAGNQEFHILSRICFCGMDYTGRSNFLAHHVSFEHYETFQVTAGPAAPFMQSGLFREVWNEESHYFPAPVQLMPQVRELSKAATWESYTGDAGWAGVLAQQFLSDPAGAVYIVFDPQQHRNLLSLVDEALMLLPENVRWQVTFSTYFTTMPPEIL